MPETLEFQAIKNNQFIGQLGFFQSEILRSPDQSTDSMMPDHSSTGCDRKEFERLIAAHVETTIVWTPQTDFYYPDSPLKPQRAKGAKDSQQAPALDPGESPSHRASLSSADRPGQLPPALIFPGAFNPVHRAHLEMARLAQSKQQLPLWFEISVINAEKGVLSYEATRVRTGQPFSPFGLILTRAATFAEKAKLFKGSMFVVGADTIRRVGQPKYYQNCENQMESAFKIIAQYQCRFLVFARKIGNKLYSESNIELQPELSKLCDFVSPDEFQLDYSSTQIRAAKQS